MVNAEHLCPALRGKSRSEQLRLVQSIVDANKRGRFPLGEADRGVLSKFISLLQQGRAVDDSLLRAVSGVVRHYVQHLIATTRGVP